MIYFDNAATTNVDKEVVKEMDNMFMENFGNPNSLHKKGQDAFKKIEESREVIASEINASTKEIVFTSGGTESNNLAFNILEKGDHFITTMIEHPSAYKRARDLEKKGIEVTFLKVDSDGFVDFEELKNSIKENTKLVSVIHGNNEIGTVQDLSKIGEVCKENNVYFHSDCVQSFKKEKIDVKEFKLSMLSISGHKIHGPKGIGALFVKEGTKLESIMKGGEQENELRPGTQNTPGIVGLGKAASMDLECDKVKGLRDHFIKKVEENISNVELNGSRERRLCNNANFSFKNIEGESILMSLDMEGVCVSTGSACTSKSLKPSRILTSLGLSAEEAHGSIRFTFSRYNTYEEVDFVVEKLKNIVERLRSISAL